MSSPLITVVLPTYQRPKLLIRAIGSVLEQGFPHFQILVTDNASGPETDAVMQHFIQKDARIKWLKQPANIGMTANFQTALMQVTTPYVCFLPDDDFFGPSFFEDVLPFFDHYPDIACCGGGGLMIDSNHLVQEILVTGQTIPKSGYYPAPSGLFAYLRSSFGITFPGLLFKTECVEQVGGFDPRVRIGIDEDLASKCFARFPVYLLTDYAHYFGFQNPLSLSRTIDFSLFEQECLIFYEHLQSISFTPQEREEIDVFFKNRRLKILANAYRYHCDRKAFVDAYACAEKMQVLTNSAQWKTKKRQAYLYRHCPILYPLYMSLKTLERHLRGKKQTIQAFKDYPEHPDQVKWKAYALKLEQDIDVCKK